MLFINHTKRFRTTKKFGTSGGKQNGFTLIELLVVISIIGTLVGLIVNNLADSRARARDARKKQNLNQMKTALRMYYNDYQAYPAGQMFGCSLGVNVPKACGPDGDECCPYSGCDADFTAGGTDGCDTTYLTSFPGEMGSSLFYYQADNGDGFCLKVTLENKSDPDIASSWQNCNSACSSLTGSDYAVCAD